MENVISTKKTVQEFLEQYQSEVYETTIDFQNYSIPISLFISFFDLTNPEFNNLCSNHNITTINDIPKEHFIYAACEFIKTRKILETFNIPQNISIRYQELLTQQKIDFEALNQYLTTSDTLHKKIAINDNLRAKILSEMPKNMSILEKAIYIYIKMCKLFTYDDEYIAAKNQEFIFEKHKDLNYISKITPENNRIVCFEFNIIYTKLLEELGIHFKSNYKDADTEAYGLNHVKLKYRVKKFIIQADSVTSILRGDLVKSKLNEPLIGLKCINKNLTTQQEFQNIVTKVYERIIEQEKKQGVYQETLPELLKEYNELTTNKKEISNSEKIEILTTKLNNAKLVGIDAISYTVQLIEILFQQAELNRNIAATLIGNYSPNHPEKNAETEMILTCNETDINIAEWQNIYYYVNSKNQIMQVSKEFLIEKFQNKEFDYLEEQDKIPGL